MISRFNLALALAVALAGLALLAVVTVAVNRNPQTDMPQATADGPARDGLSDAMTFAPPAGARP